MNKKEITNPLYVENSDEMLCLRHNKEKMKRDWFIFTDDCSDYFDIIGDRMYINSWRNKIAVRSFIPQTAYGHLTINPKHKNIKHCWTFKTHMKGDFKGINIGIDEINKINKRRNWDFNGCQFANMTKIIHTYYSYKSDGYKHSKDIGFREKYHYSYGFGGLIKMYLYNKILSFELEGGKEKIAFKNIETNKKYKMAVSMCTNDNSIDLHCYPENYSLLELLDYRRIDMCGSNEPLYDIDVDENDEKNEDNISDNNSNKQIEQTITENKTTKFTGVCKIYFIKRGFGFITPDDDTLDGDIFVHQSELYHKGFRSLQKGELVEFDIEYENKNGKKSRKKAVNVTGPNGQFVQGQKKV
eukprot:536444_1